MHTLLFGVGIWRYTEPDMSEEHDTIEQAIEMAVRGAPDDGIRLLWPLIRDDATRDPALFALAFCYEKAENFATATYLYEWIVEQHSEFNVAAKRLEECREETRRRGITEDFEDAGHVSCPCGLFRQRAEYGACPYCGRLRDETRLRSGEAEIRVVPTEAAREESARAVAAGGETETVPVPEGQNRAQSKDLSAVVEKIHELKEDAATQMKELSETESIKRVAARAEELAREASSRMKALAESDAAKDALEKAKELRRETSSRVKRIIEKPEVQELEKKLKDWGKEKTSDITKWVKGERVQTASKKILETFEGVLARIQAVIDRMKN